MSSVVNETMYRTKGVLLTLFVLAVGCNGIELPAYIKTCSVHDPNLNDCFATNANLAIEAFKYGDANFDIPPIDNFTFFDKLQLETVPGVPLKMIIKNCRKYGLENLRVKSANIDLAKKHFEVLFIGPKITWECSYEAEAEVLPGKLLTDEGTYNISYNNGEYLYKLDYNLKDMDGKQFIDITAHSVDFLTVDLVHDLDNIGKNPVLNNLWEQVKPHFASKVITQACSDMGTEMINKFFKVFPYNIIFRTQIPL